MRTGGAVVRAGVVADAVDVEDPEEVGAAEVARDMAAAAAVAAAIPPAGNAAAAAMHTHTEARAPEDPKLANRHRRSTWRIQDDLKTRRSEKKGHRRERELDSVGRRGSERVGGWESKGDAWPKDDARTNDLDDERERDHELKRMPSGQDKNRAGERAREREREREE